MPPRVGKTAKAILQNKILPRAHIQICIISGKANIHRVAKIFIFLTDISFPGLIYRVSPPTLQLLCLLQHSIGCENILWEQIHVEMWLLITQQKPSVFGKAFDTLHKTWIQLLKPCFLKFFKSTEL